jgi:hypothetical protein
MYTLQPSPLPPPPLKAYLEPRADARVTPAIHPTTPLSLEIASKSPMMLPLLAAVVTSMRRVATISTGWQTVYSHSPARQPSVSARTRERRLAAHPASSRKRDHPPASTSACRQRQIFLKASWKASRREAMAVRPPQGPGATLLQLGAPAR